MPDSVLDSSDISTLQYVVTHVFFPIQLPNGDDHNIDNDCSLTEAIAAAARLYTGTVCTAESNMFQWNSILRTLDNLRTIVQSQSLEKAQIVSQLGGMLVGDVLAFLIRAQNVAVVFRRQEKATIFESFEVSPKAENVMAAQGKLICSYPGPAIAVPNDIFDDEKLRLELVNFLVHMNNDILPDAAATTRKAKSTVLETRDTTHPRYITELLTGILRSVGHPADVVRLTKRIGDDVVWNNSELPWRRSSLWLLIRVVLQTTLDRSPLGRAGYKEFLLFFMCCLGKEQMCGNLPNDVLQFMSAKISRRLRKLGSSAPDWLSQMVLDTCTSLRWTVGRRWTDVQVAQRVSPRWNPSELDLRQDIRLSMLSSRDFLRNRLVNQITDHIDSRFSHKHHARGGLNEFLSSHGELFEGAYQAEPYVALYDVEQAVEKEIDGWVDRATRNDDACVQLEILANRYSSRALETYGSNPELLSVMLLTMVELWVALDKIAVRGIPMLAEYSPEIPMTLLEELLLCKSASLDRLRQAHEYLSRRHSLSRHGWSVFSSGATTDTFAVRYYKQSSHLQRLKARIEEVARCELCEKVAELERANARYAELQREAAELEHIYYTDRHGHARHSRYCKKCDLEKQQQMQISVHEWPLPAGELHTAIVVFELDCPVSFNMWRTATFRLLVDLCSPSPEPKNPYIKLEKYEALQPYHVQHPGSRITLVSDTKPFVVTHYRKTAIPSTRELVCVPNGLRFYGFDCRARVPTSKALGYFDVRRYCTYQLQNGPYKNLQVYVDGTSHTSNEVMANQSDCHKDLSIHEFISYGHLRSGGQLQWLNVLRELRGRSLSFRRHEVHFLLAQAVSQVGPLDDGDWEWHRELQEPSFCHALISELESVVRDVEANWLEGGTMDMISLVLRRVLASGCDGTVSRKALRLLRIIRGNMFNWLKELSAKLTRSSEDEEFRAILRDNAAICRGTFDVDPALFYNVLNFAEDTEILVYAAILIHDHTPSKVTSLPAYSQLLLDRDRRLSLALEDFLSVVIQADSDDDGVDGAIGRIWHGYRPRSKWDPLEYPNSRWFSCMTAPTDQQCSQVVHLNILDGSLLVDGKPLGRLPKEIIRHPLYNLVFGEKVLDVIPGDLPGMDYSTRGTISNHLVYFSLRDDSDLVIQAKRQRPASGDSEIFTLVPQHKLKGDLPAVLIEGHVHWLNLSTSVMAIRPLDKIWDDSPDDWKVDCAPGRYRMYRARESLVDIRSSSWAMLSDLLKPLDASQNLLVTASPIDLDGPSPSLRLSVVLPRYGLAFYVDEDGDLRSRNMRGMVYDESQCIGTLFGLVNRLILRPKIKDVDSIDLIPRCVLIPEGEVSFNKGGHHVCVTIDTKDSALARVTCQSYRIDTDLGCLTTVGLTNRLYCAYLHALTSGCIADPLTGRTGTEEALSLLWSASCWSIMKFSSRDIELLGLIASLCPPRTWYPKHLKCMQQVSWLDLPATSQHHEFYVVSKAIKRHYERIQLFHENQSNGSFDGFPSREDHLLERSARRTVYLLPSESSWTPSGADGGDVWYGARDVIEHDSGEHRAYMAATTVYRRAPDTTITKDVLSMVESWTEPVSGEVELSLQYNVSWLTPKLPLMWLKAYNLLRKSNSEREQFQMLFSLPAMAYASPDLSDLVPIFVAFASQRGFRSEDPPGYNSYTLSDGYYPSRDVLSGYVGDSARSFEGSPESSEPQRNNENLRDWAQRKRRMYNTRVGSDTHATINYLLQSWPCENPPRCSLNLDLYDVASFSSNARSHFSSCYHNLKLREHLIRVQEILDIVPVFPTRIARYGFQPSRGDPSCIDWRITVKQLFSRPEPTLQTHDRLPRYPSHAGNTSFVGAGSLRQLMATAEENTVDPFQHRYISTLRTSAESFESEMSLESHEETRLPETNTLTGHYTQCKVNCTEALRHLQRCLGPIGQSENALKQSGQWPRITPRTLLGFLASNSPVVLSEGWKRCLVQLALLALELQRARRLLLLHLNRHDEELGKELQNEGCDGWNAEGYPDWLLIQLQGNFFVRRVQVEVANEMISPRSGDNTAMQLNMGEGKSSVIVPIVVSALANRDQLVRVIVPKALTAQMFHILVDRLGGLTNRRIYFLPFSRSLEIDDQGVATLREIMTECMTERGILVVQPEHVLSLKLVSVEKQLPRSEGTPLGVRLLELQKWLHSHARDIMDESDEILHVRYQLVYTIGNQQHMEGFPERWTTTQQILGLVKKHAASLQNLFPLGVEYECGSPGSFPHLRVLHADAGEKLISWVLDDVTEDRLPNFNFGKLSSDIKEAIRSFISHERVPAEQVQSVKGYSEDSHLWGGVLLLRGLLSTGILLFAFRERRYRVDYGLALSRTMLAVPYRAKDVPAQRAEFGHPDVAIILTCLSYYYRGLDEDQLRQCFEILLKQDDPSIDYDLWVRECSTVPDRLRALNGINLKSSGQWHDDLVPLLSRNKATIDFYLSKVVFPKEAKAFPFKLSCSGWDLAEKRERLLTGFSGTNDGQYLLPLHITQRDPDHERGTNAKVLSYLLQPENGHYMCMSRENGERRTAREFLEILVAQMPEIRVLLDVGAQMLELENRELVKVWLDMNPDASAAIYFNDDDELTVLTKDGNTQLFSSSPFAQQLDQCVVYLDDAHTRGTDIKFPSGFRAAVTLGPKVTKDRLVQGCMRMRKLGHGHSIMFFAPLEVDRNIRSVANRDLDRIDTLDILHWAIRETCRDIQQRAPHWAQQGTDHASRYIAWFGFCNDQVTPRELSDKWLQQEAKTLEGLYGPQDTLIPSMAVSPAIRQRCVELGIMSLRDVSMDEEQEREVVHEAERERQVERPPKAPPALHSVHRDVIAFVRTGIVRVNSNAFCTAFKTLDATSAASNEAHVWSSFLLATTDFERTVSSRGNMDDHLRPVQWIVSGKTEGNDVFVIVSPHEANHLLPHIRSSDHVHLHVYTPRVTKTIKPCDNLDLYNVPAIRAEWTAPPLLVDQLNVFAGQLYLKDHEAYIRLCRFLCVYTRDLENEEGIVLGYNGFIAPSHRPRRLQGTHKFQSAPLLSMRTLMGIRRKGMQFTLTHMGKLLDGRLLSEDDFAG